MSEPAEPRPSAADAAASRRAPAKSAADQAQSSAATAGRSGDGVPRQPGGSPSNAEDKTALATAFRETHERRIHAFALLLTLGDRPRAARLADEALSAAEPRVATLVHPERGAAWLRQRVLRRASRGAGALSSLVSRGRPKPRAIAEVGADTTLMTALASLSLRDRAALILNDVEGIRELDIADILGTPRAEVDRTVRKARARYGRAYLAASRANGTLDEAKLPEVIREAARPALRAPTKTVR